MDTSREYYENIVKSFNLYNGFHAQLVDGAGNVLLPKADVVGQTVTFNMRVEYMLMLYNLTAANATVAGRAIAFHTLYHLFMLKNMYSKAGEVLQRLEECLVELARTSYELHPGIVLAQACFLIGHELSHILYHALPDKRDKDTCDMRDAIDHELEMVDDRRSLRMKLLRWLMPKSAAKQRYSLLEAKDDPELMEELLCDNMSWCMMKQLMTSQKVEGEMLGCMCAHIALVLNYLEVHQAIENFYLDPEQDLQDFELRFNSARHLINGQIVWYWLYNEHSPEVARHYQTFIRKHEKRDRWIVMGQVWKNLISYPEVRLPRQKLDMVEVKRLDSLYKHIMRENL